MKTRRLLWGGVSHGLALLAGCLVWQALGPVKDFRRMEAGRREPGVEPRKASQRDVPGTAAGGHKGGRSAKDDRWKEEDARVAGARRELQALGEPGDLKAAVEGELAALGPGAEGNSSRLAALLYRWVERDAAGYLEWRKGPGGHGVGVALERHLETAMGVMAGRKSVAEIAGMAAGQPEEFVSVILEPWIVTLLRRPDLDQLAVVEGVLSRSQWGTFAYLMAQRWPEEYRDVQARWAVRQGDINLILTGVSFTGGRVNTGDAVCLARLLEDPALPEAFRTALWLDPRSPAALSGDREVPLKLRLEAQRLLLGRYSGAMDQAAARLCAWDARCLLVDGEVDWPYLFRKGVVSAGEVDAELARATPELAAVAPEELRRVAFEVLAASDFAGAKSLLPAGLSEEQRGEVLLDAAGLKDAVGSPENFREIMQEAPAGRKWITLWGERSGLYFEALGEGYVGWVEKLAPGLDRDAALAGLLHQVRDARESKRLAAQIANPEIRKLNGLDP